MLIDRGEACFLQKRQRDDTGSVFSWNGRVFRAILPGREVHVQTLFSSGFLDELSRQAYFPRTWMTDYSMEGFSLILEHERIWPVIYPQEWTFSMLKDAAVLVCRIAAIAKTHGFNMRDCHGLNVLYDGVSPKFSDLGSFIPDVYSGWRPYEEFLRFYYYPLRMWRYDSFVGKLSIFSGNLVPHDSYWLHASPLLRQLRPEVVNKLIRLRLRFELLPSRPIADFQSRTWSGRKVAHELVRRKILPTKNMNLDRLAGEIQTLKRSSVRTTWGTYHDDVKQKAQRFDRIIEIVNMLGDDLISAVDLGGNQGKFCRLLAERTRLTEILCVDHDEGAVDIGYQREKSSGTGKISFAHYDFMGCIVKLRFPLPAERFKADVVFALALSHHLLLSQGYGIEYILKNISAYAKRHVFIEFMPFGLWPGSENPPTPPWYTLDWFRRSFSEFFELVLEEELRTNNVLFVGKLRSS